MLRIEESDKKPVGFSNNKEDHSARLLPDDYERFYLFHPLFFFYICYPVPSI